VRRTGDTSENLIGILECRLDAVIYRLKFVPTVFAARQVVSHGHIKVNGVKVTIPSYMVKIGDKVELRDKAKTMGLILDAMDSGERDVPDYVEVDHNQGAGSMTRIPQLADVPYPVQMEPNLVVEFYSR